MVFPSFWSVVLNLQQYFEKQNFLFQIHEEKCGCFSVKSKDLWTVSYYDLLKCCVFSFSLNVNVIAAVTQAMKSDEKGKVRNKLNRMKYEEQRNVHISGTFPTWKFQAGLDKPIKKWNTLEQTTFSLKCSTNEFVLEIIFKRCVWLNLHSSVIKIKRIMIVISYF